MRVHSLGGATVHKINKLQFKQKHNWLFKVHLCKAFSLRTPLAQCKEKKVSHMCLRMNRDWLSSEYTTSFIASGRPCFTWSQITARFFLCLTYSREREKCLTLAATVDYHSNSRLIPQKLCVGSFSLGSIFLDSKKPTSYCYSVCLHPVHNSFAYKVWSSCQQ